MLFYSFISGFIFYGFLMALLLTNWVNVCLSGLLCIMWLREAFIKKIEFEEELKDD